MNGHGVTGAIDRRVVRTRATLHQTLLSLILERGYEAISVQDICDKADIGRSTFYAHYTGKDDLKRAGLQHLKNALKGGEGELSFMRALFEHGRDHVHLYHALKNSLGAEVSVEALRTILLELVEEGMAAQSMSRTERNLRARYLSGALLSVLTWWLDNGATVPVEEVEAVIRRLTPQS
ncbi:MAG: TetR/AcrR family transcriptional regulator [Asticcacaulis sp.]